MKSLANCKVTVVGLGLMGGSLALALRSRCAEIVGVDSDGAALAFAQQHGIVDRAAEFDAALDCDVLVLATPVRTILAQLDSLSQSAVRNHTSATVIDLGSTKRDIVAAMDALPSKFDPIGGHPLCGKESSGIGAAAPDLFRGATFVLSPLPRTSPDGLTLARQLVAAIGAHPFILDAAQHDRLLGVSSHLPYLLACVLVNAAEQLDDDLIWQLAASGFRDTSRLAASDVKMMCDILRTNRTEILSALAAGRAELDRLAALIESQDEAALYSALAQARQRRMQLFSASTGRVPQWESHDAVIDLWPGA